MKKRITVLSICSVFAFSSFSFAGGGMHLNEDLYKEHEKEFSPYAEDYFPTNVYFGDTHLHTWLSVDAGLGGGTATPEDAYRVSRGEQVTSQLGWKVKLIRPLDFVVVADHAENLGLSDFIQRSDPLVLANEKGKQWHDMVKAGKGYDAYLEWLRADNNDLIKEPKMVQSAWENVIDNADKYYQPGVFTTFHGYEWTSHPGGNNLHRVVIFRDGEERTRQVVPFSQYDSVDPEDLWKYMAAYEEKTGGQILGIPHNGNLSNGLMFAVETYTTKEPLSKEYAENRTRFEPLVEVTQMKGDGETHPLLSPDDAFADYETFAKGNLNGTQAKTEDMLPREYARMALKEGLRLGKELGANPFKFGMVGATDAHNALPTTRQENYFSKAYIVEPEPERYKHVLIQAPTPELSMLATDLGTGGLSAVWARENTRESLWDAMSRKEAFATTGTRIRVRVFAGWDFEKDEVSRPDFAREGYKRGVPMGGDLKRAPEGKAPTFMVRALRDPDGANLDRVQMIKGWLDSNGKTHEKIYDIAVSDDREIDADGQCKTEVGSTVDIGDASYTNTIGDAAMGGYWVDPEFDPKQDAFYYVRVIEIPTPRWTAYDAKRFNVEMPEGTKMVTQERAYTSPIWYTP